MVAERLVRPIIKLYCFYKFVKINKKTAHLSASGLIYEARVVRGFD